MLLVASSLRAQESPSLKLLSPADGQTIDGPVAVHIQHSGIRFDGVAVSKAPQPGVGHWHVNIDGTYAGLADTDVIEIPNETYPAIATGVHTITVTLHENNHALTSPPVVQTIKLNYSKTVKVPDVVAGPPTLKLVNPGQSKGSGTPIDVNIEHTGIRFDGLQIGKAPAPGVGHWHVYVDGKYAGLGVSNVIEIPNDAVPVIPAGSHTITASLHANNHAALDPPVAQSFQIALTQELRLGSSPATAAGTAATTAGATTATAAGTAATTTGAGVTTGAATATTATTKTGVAAATAVSGVTTMPLPLPLPNTGSGHSPLVPAAFVVILVLLVWGGALLRVRSRDEKQGR